MAEELTALEREIDALLNSHEAAHGKERAVLRNEIRSRLLRLAEAFAIDGEDELQAWRAFYDEPGQEKFRDPRAEDTTDQLTTAGLRRVLVTDRARVALRAREAR